MSHPIVTLIKMGHSDNVKQPSESVTRMFILQYVNLTTI